MLDHLEKKRYLDEIRDIQYEKNKADHQLKFLQSCVDVEAIKTQHELTNQKDVIRRMKTKMDAQLAENTELKKRNANLEAQGTKFLLNFGMNFWVEYKNLQNLIQKMVKNMIF